MKKMLIAVTACAIAVVSLNSCKKSDTTTNTPSNNPPSVTPPADANAAFAAVRVKSTQTVAGITVPIDVNTAVAWFGSASTPVDGGNVSCEGVALSKINGMYTFQPTATNTSIDLSSPISWVVSGNAANSVPSFSKDDNHSFPYVDDITNPGDINIHSSFTLSATSTVTYCDSVIFVVAGPSGNVKKIKPAGTSSCTFTQAEMETVGTGSGIVQIAPYRVSLDNTIAAGKNYYFVLETCANRFVTFK
ncbi:MAG: hypothetical protein U0T73_01605 [Chitinophagales bacterium]